MPCELKLHAHDVTLNCRPERKASIFRPPQRVYSIVREREMFTLGFDGAKIRIPGLGGRPYQVRAHQRRQERRLRQCEV